MSEVSRRDVVKFAAALALGSSAATAGLALAEETAKPAGAPQAPNVADESLAWANSSPQSFMLIGPATFHLEGDGYSRDLYITSARDLEGKSNRVRIPSGSMRVFRADAAVDEFTKQGGLHWRFHNQQGKVKLKQAEAGLLGTNDRKLSRGAIVMVVREDDTVRCYTMTPDDRC